MSFATSPERQVYDRISALVGQCPIQIVGDSNSDEFADGSGVSVIIDMPGRKRVAWVTWSPGLQWWFDSTAEDE